MITSAEARIVELVVRKHGPTLDLDGHPEVLVEVLRRYGPAMARTTPAPTGWRRLYRGARRRAGVLRRRITRRQPVHRDPMATAPTQPSNAEIMRELLALRRTVAGLAGEPVAATHDLAGSGDR